MFSETHIHRLYAQGTDAIELTCAFDDARLLVTACEQLTDASQIDPKFRQAPAPLSLNEIRIIKSAGEPAIVRVIRRLGVRIEDAAAQLTRPPPK